MGTGDKPSLRDRLCALVSSLYRLGHNPVAACFVGGLPVVVRPDAAWRLSALP